MSKSSLRIVLVDPLGEVLFSGQSLSLTAPEAVEACPETKRSSQAHDSGIYRSLARASREVSALEGADDEAPVTLPENPPAAPETTETPSRRTHAA